MGGGGCTVGFGTTTHRLTAVMGEQRTVKP